MIHSLLQERYDAAALHDAEFLAAYNAKTVEVAIPVIVADFAQYAEKEVVPTLLAALEDSDVTGSLRVCVHWALRLPQSKFDDFSMESPAFLQGLATLQNYSILNEAQIEGMLNFGYRLVSQSEIDHGRATTSGDLKMMRNQPHLLTVAAQRARVVARIIELTSPLNTLLAALDAQRSELNAGGSVVLMSEEDLEVILSG